MAKVVLLLESALASPILWGVLALLALALAFSGRLSVTASTWIVWVAWGTAVFGVYRAESVAKLDTTIKYLALVMLASMFAIGAVFLTRWMSAPQAKEVASTPSAAISPAPATTKSDIAESVKEAVKQIPQPGGVTDYAAGHVANAPQPAKPATDKIPEEGFHEKIESVTVFVGEGGMADTEPVTRLRAAPYTPFSFGRNEPITLSMDEDKINIDVKIGATPIGPALEIHNNEFTVRNPTLDRNFSSKALEVVNREQRVMLQVYWKTPSQLVLNGIFPNGRGYILAGPDGAQGSATVPDTFKLKPIFKYPSWKHLGEYAEP